MKLNDISDVNIDALADKSSKLAQLITHIMNVLGVTRLANVYIDVVQDSTHGEQIYLHIDGHECDLERNKISNSSDICYDYGEFRLPYSYPSLDAVLEFIDSIEDVNRAIYVVKSRIDSAIKSAKQLEMEVNS